MSATVPKMQATVTTRHWSDRGATTLCTRYDNLVGLVHNPDGTLTLYWEHKPPKAIDEWVQLDVKPQDLADDEHAGNLRKMGAGWLLGDHVRSPYTSGVLPDCVTRLVEPWVLVQFAKAVDPQSRIWVYRHEDVDFNGTWAYRIRGECHQVYATWGEALVALGDPS